MQIGRKIYYDKLTGKVILDTGECEGCVQETTLEQDAEAFSSIQASQDNLGVIKLEFGYEVENFAKYPYSIDITKEGADAIVWDTANPYSAVEVAAIKTP